MQHFQRGNKLTLQIFPVGSEAKEPQISDHHELIRSVKIIKMRVRFGFYLEIKL
jgi:hypothetical protein